MLREEVLREWKTLKDSFQRLKEDLEIYQASKLLEIRCWDKEQTREFLKRHYARCFKINKNNPYHYFLDIDFKNESGTGIFDLGDKNYFPGFLRFCVRGASKKDFKLICRTHDADGNIGFGFKKIGDNFEWVGLNQMPTLYLNGQQKYQQENFHDEIDGWVTEINFLGKK